MGNFDAAAVIQAAATSNLGVISLIVLVLAFLAWRFFQRSEDRVKLVAFAMMFLGAAGFAGAVLLTDIERDGDGPRPRTAANVSADPSSSEAPSSDASGTGTVPNIAGTWHGPEGYRFTFSQDGEAFTYETFLNGARVGSGTGSIAGTRMTYRFTDTANGNEGNCEADISIDARTIRGTCNDGNARWNFAIER